MNSAISIVPLPAFNDNYIWLARAGSEAMCVDPGQAAPVLAYLHEHKLQLQQIWITHHHNDHTGGIDELLAAFPQAAVYGNSDIPQATLPAGEGSETTFAGQRAHVWAVPGHTDKHLAYLWPWGGRLHVFCGDTLFSAGCGRVFTGTIEQLHQSFQRLNSLPDDTLFYPAHEYTAANLRFAAHIEPENQAIADTLAGLQQPSLPVSLAHERRINPFLRSRHADVAERTAELFGQTLPGEADVFAALRELKNRF